jgi:preprotein translocase subunit Sss1
MGNKVTKVVTTPFKVVQNAADLSRTISSIPLNTAKNAAKTIDSVQKVAPKVVDVVGSKDTWNAVGDAGKGILDAGKDVVDAGVSVAKETGKVAKGVVNGTGDFIKILEWTLIGTLAIGAVGGTVYVISEARKKQ